MLGWTAAGMGIFLIAYAVVKELTRFNLAGKVVLITGGSRGFGFVLAQHLARRGAKLALCARSADDLELARQALDAGGTEVITMTADVTKNEEVKAMIRDIIKHYRTIDVLVNNASMIQVDPQHLREQEAYQLAMQTNFWAQLYTMQAVIPYFAGHGGGRIVNITSIGGKIAVPNLPPYTSGKLSIGLSEGMHTALKKHNIHVTTVIPNVIRTDSPVYHGDDGDRKKENTWLKHAELNPILLEDADKAAERIIQAMEYGEPEVNLSLNGKIATLIKGIAPGWITILMSIAHKLLPEASTNIKRIGREAESKFSG